MIPTCWTILAALVAGVAAQGTVTVLMNDPSVSYANNGLPLPASSGYDSVHCESLTTLPSNGYSAGILFNGTSVTVTFLLDSTGGPATVYVDGSAVQTTTSLGPGSVSGSVDSCDQTVITTPTLSSGAHNLTVVNTGGGEVYLHSFVYRSLAASASVTTSNSVSSTIASSASSSSTSATSLPPAAESKKSSSAPAIAGAVAGVAALIIAFLLFIFLRRRRRRRNAPSPEHSPIEPREVVSGPAALVTPYYSVDHLPSTGSAFSPTGSTSALERSPLTAGMTSTTSKQRTSSDFSAPTITSRAPTSTNPRSVTASSRSDDMQSTAPSGSDGQRRVSSVRNPDGQRQQQQSSGLSQPVEVIQQLLARDIPNTEISAVIRMMAGPNQPQSQTQPQTERRDSGDNSEEMPPPQYQAS
ncbi:hypothetical protein FRB95_000556 [Tulasnella sp. JGI-2019a]|nr:hypothetical protein FRB95_000556 [Tulasnella sp. JGI-2019a]